MEPLLNLNNQIDTTNDLVDYYRDPIHNYIPYTANNDESSNEVTEKTLITSRATSASKRDLLTSRIASLILLSESLLFPCKALKLLDRRSVKLSNIAYDLDEISYYIIFYLNKETDAVTIHPTLCCLFISCTLIN